MGKVVSKALTTRLAYQQRVGRSVSIQEVADAVGLTRAALSRLENNRTEQIAFDTLRKLCEYYGVKPGDLLDYEDRRARYATLAGTVIA